MKRGTLTLLLLTAVVLLVSCKPLSRNNPYDPANPDYLITYKGEQWRPDGSTVRAMTWANGLVLGAKKDPEGDCVIVVNNSAATIIGTTGTTVAGTFTDIYDLCTDPSNNVYIADATGRVQVMDTGFGFTQWNLTYTILGSLSLEYFGGNIFVSNTVDKTVQKYTTAGTLVDTKTVTVCAAGYFTPGRIIKTASFLYVVNALDKSKAIKYDASLNNLGEVNFEYPINDAVLVSGNCEIATETAVKTAGDSLAVSKTWGDFGEGPGKILTGNLITHDGTDFYILDGVTIKIFGR